MSTTRRGFLAGLFALPAAGMGLVKLFKREPKPVVMRFGERTKISARVAVAINEESVYTCLDCCEPSTLKKGHHLLNARTREVIRLDQTWPFYNGVPKQWWRITRSVGLEPAEPMNFGDDMLVLGFQGAEHDEPTQFYNWSGEMYT